MLYDFTYPSLWIGLVDYMKIKIGNKWIGDDCPTFIVFDIGSNYWDGKKASYKQVCALIDVAAQAGIDALKGQTFHASELFSKKEGPEGYAEIKKLEMPISWWPKLKKYAESKGLIFFSTPFSIKDADLLEKLNMQVYKVASAQATDTVFLKHIARKMKPIILSTGGCSLEEISTAIQTIKDQGNNKIILLQCITKYDPKFKLSECNVTAMLHLKKCFGLPVGYSDHSGGTLASAVAVALGACVIEKHLTLDRKNPAPDSPFAINPAEAKRLVKEIKEVEQILGSPEKRCIESEISYISVARKSIYARVDIPKGTKITEKMLVTLRPPKGIEPRYWDYVLGRKARKKIESDRPITWDMI